jgi:hypothetical protein
VKIAYGAEASLFPKVSLMTAHVTEDFHHLGSYDDVSFFATTYINALIVLLDLETKNWL